MMCMCVCVLSWDFQLCFSVFMLVLVFPVSATQFLCHTGGGDETYPVREIQLHADGAQLFKMMMMVVSVIAIQSDTLYLHNHF